MSESKSWFYSVTDIDGNEHHFPIVNITRLIWDPSSKAGFLFLNGFPGCGTRIDRDCYVDLIARMATVAFGVHVHDAIDAANEAIAKTKQVGVEP